MGCFKPLTAFQSIEKKSKNGRSIITFNNPSGDMLPIQLPCGRCIGCRLERSKQWAIRCTHEASLHAENSFITLTYNDKFLPPDESLSVRDWQLFLKRLRKHIQPKKIRFFHCGEYGDKFGRPHYHALIFGHEFPDKTFLKKQNDVSLYTSETLSKIWGQGFVSIGDVTFESAAYVARYIVKKITGEMAEKHYETYNRLTGEIYSKKPEYNTMSRRPGIAKDWFDQYHADIYPHDFVVHGTNKLRPPKFYDGLYEIAQPDQFEILKEKRVLRAFENMAESTPERLAVKEKIQIRNNKLLQRNLEK